MLALGLFLASDLLGTSIPDQALQRIKAEAQIQPLAAQVCANVFVGLTAPSTPLPTLHFTSKCENAFVIK